MMPALRKEVVMLAKHNPPSVVPVERIAFSLRTNDPLVIAAHLQGEKTFV